MSSETVAETVAGCSPGNARTFHRGGYLPADGAFVEMVAAFAAGTRVDRQDGGREDILPFPFFGGLREFSLQGRGEVDFTEAAGQVLLVEDLNLAQVFEQCGLEGFGEHRAAVLVPLAFPDGDFVSGKIEVLDPEAKAFQKAHAGAMEELRDALSRNLPKDLRTIVANCLAHARRQFVDVHDRFSEQCRHLLETLAIVYRNDAEARERGLSALERLRWHQEKSGPVMEELQAWLTRQFEEKLAEPHSALGGAIRYMQRHWDKLTLFLRQAGAPLDNNVCERALKKAILHRKNSLFYKTRKGAKVGDWFMSLIYTCQLNGVNPFDYLTQLQRHADRVAATPQDWLPWNYRAQLDQPAA